MKNNSVKQNIFFNNINNDARIMCDKIRSDVDKYVETELNMARKIAHEQVRDVKKSELDRLNEENNIGFSELEALEKKKLLDRRTQITDEIFQRAEEKLKNFVESKDYLDFLKRSIAEIKNNIGENAIIILRPEDKKLESELSAICYQIKYDSNIKLGGCKGENTTDGFIADDTLEARLEEEKIRFYKTSGMTVTL